MDGSDSQDSTKAERDGFGETALRRSERHRTGNLPALRFLFHNLTST